MLRELQYVQVWVHDQDEALAFYTEKLGMELREDVTVPEMGNFRWVSVGLFFSTDDIQKTYEELKSRGVEFTQEPTEQPYGVDAGFRDPSGNHFRMAQPPA